MKVYELHPSSLPNGEFAAAWFDDEQLLWDDDRLHKAPSLIGDWRAPRLRMLREQQGVTDVLFNPNGIAVCDRVREALRPFSEIEFLPVAIARFVTFYLVHVTATIDALPEFSMRRAPPPSGNVVELYQFPVDFACPAAFFRVRQPADSAAGRAGYCLPEIYVNDSGARAVMASCAGYWEARPLPRTV
jgi:hypothetical protein